MKTLTSFALCLFIAFASFAQSNRTVEILLIGTSHSYNTATEKFEPVKERIRNFQPALVFSENLSPEDYDALDRYWNQKGIDRIMAQLNKTGYPAPKNLDRFIRDQYKLLAKYPNYHQDRMKLAHALFFKHDFGNAAYQLYLLDQAKAAFGSEEQEACARILVPVDSLKNLGIRRTSEYHNIFFPVAQELKIQKMTPMDCQTYNTSWEAAWAKADSLYRVFEKKIDKADTNSASYKAYNQVMRRYKELEKKARVAQREGSVTMSLNTAEGDEYLNIVNFYTGTRLFALDEFPKEAITDMLNYWKLRNEGMCRNIVDRARAAKARRVVVAVGSNHRRIMYDLFLQMPNVLIRTLNKQ